jgi:hypothetical protein
MSQNGHSPASVRSYLPPDLPDADKSDFSDSPREGSQKNRPNPELAPDASGRKTGRRYSLDYKRRILDEADRCEKPGEIGALLRREGLYASTLRDFRIQRSQGLLDPGDRNRIKTEWKEERESERHRLDDLERENRALRRKLAHAEIVIEVQKKLSEMLGIPLDSETRR